jgi:hypothetical protein
MTSIIRTDELACATPGARIQFQGSPGLVLATTMINNSTRTATSASANLTVFSGSFTKTTSTSNILVTCNVVGGQYNSGNSGVGFVLDGSTWDWGTAYNYDGLWTNANAIVQVVGTGFFTGVTAGAHTMGWGWLPRDGTAQRAFNFLNPNSADDGRNGQFISSLIIYEIAT